MMVRPNGVAQWGGPWRDYLISRKISFRQQPEEWAISTRPARACSPAAAAAAQPPARSCPLAAAVAVVAVVAATG
jgi:hypothetical protein